MSLEHELLKQRLQRTHEITALGQRPYGARFDASHSLPQLWAEHSAKTAEELDAAKIPVRVAGRINSLRGKGKAGFMHLEQGGQKLQVYIKVDNLSENDFKLYQLLDIGDILGCSPSTVIKHLEHVFEKLGVETRTAAANLAMNKMCGA